jgi:hypothetical protein
MHRIRTDQIHIACQATAASVSSSGHIVRHTRSAAGGKLRKAGKHAKQTPKRWLQTESALKEDVKHDKPMHGRAINQRNPRV